MANRFMRSFSFLLLSSSLLQAVAFAETIEGRVAAVGSWTVDVTVFDAQGRPFPNALRVNVDSATQLAGLDSVLELNEGDPVSVDARQMESKNWHADRIALLQNNKVKPVTKASPSLKDALGNPMVRGALLGAATGAIAAGASDGKAGKGALVGAGVGAAAGLLGQMFSSRSNSQENSDNS